MKIFFSLFLMFMVPLFGTQVFHDVENKISDSFKEAPHDQLQDLLKTLEDPIRYKAFVDNLKTMINLQKNKKSESELTSDLWGIFSSEIQKLSGDFLNVLGLATELPVAAKWILDELSKNTYERWIAPSFLMSLSLFMGLVIGWFSRIFLIPSQKRVSGIDVQSKMVHLFERSLQVLLWMVPYFFFAMSSYLFAVLFKLSITPLFVLGNLLYCGAVVKFIHMILRVVISPKYNTKRVVNLSDDLSKVLYQKLTLITGWGIWIYFLIALMESLGLPPLVSRLFNQTLGLAVVLQVIRIILENHKAVTAFVERRFFAHQEDFKKQQRFLEAFLQIWHIPIIILVVLIYLLNSFGIGGGFQSLLLQTGFSLIIIVIARFLRNTLKLYRKEKIDFFISSKYHKIHKKLKSRVDFFERVLAYVIYLGALQIQFTVWGMSLIGVFQDHQNHTYSFFKLLFKMGSILFLVYSIWIFVDLLIDYHIAKEDEKASKIGKSMSARIRTLVPILRNTLLVTLSAFVVIVFLSNLGIDTGPILGGVAIFSFAISFGAQSLVKDVFTGFFIILEDAVAVDDTIEVDGKKGIVEAVTIRSIRLRDDNGSVHTIPFSEVKVLTNMTRDYSYAVIEVTLPNEKNYEQIVSIVFETGNHLALDPNFGPLVLEPLEIKGIEQFTEIGIDFCCRIKTKPGEQLKVKREFYRRFKTALDKADITLPTIQKAVYLNPDL